MSDYQLTSEQVRAIVSKHGRITESGICEVLGLKKKKSSVKVEKNKHTKQFSQLRFYLKNEGIEFVSELKFCEYRDFRFDLALPEHKIAFEYNGIFSEKSRHTTVKGYSMDRQKMNLAIGLGWRVLEYTPLNIDKAITDITNLLNKKP